MESSNFGYLHIFRPRVSILDRKYSTLIIIGLFWYAPWFNILIFRAIRFFTSQILRVPEFLVNDGSSLFRQPINKAISLSILMMIGWGLSSPKNTWNQNQKGQILIKKKQYQAAIAIFNRSIEIDPDSEEAWSQKAYCLWCLNLEDLAIECFRKVLEIAPDNEYAQMSIGKIYFVREEYHQSISYLDRAVELNNQDISAYYYLGLSWLNIDEKILAYQMFDRAIQIEATEEQDWSDKASFLWHLDLLDRAVVCYQKVLKLNQHNTYARISIGKLLFGLEKYSEAIAHLEESIALNFKSIDTYYYLGMSFQKAQEYEQAEEVFDQILSLFPDNSIILRAKGILLYELKDYEVAIAIYQRLVEIEPENPIFWYDLAYCHALHNNPELAVSALQRSIEIQPEEFKQHARTDLDFASLQDNEMFKQLIER